MALDIRCPNCGSKIGFMEKMNPTDDYTYFYHDYDRIKNEPICENCNHKGLKPWELIILILFGIGTYMGLVYYIHYIGI